MKLTASALFFLAKLASVSLAVEEIPSQGTPISIPDGGLEFFSYAVITFEADLAGCTIDDVDVEIDMEHTWIGDISMTLESPGGVVVGLMERPGLDTATGCCGTSVDATGGNVITFDDAAATSSEDIGDFDTNNDGILDYPVDVSSVGSMLGPPFPAAPDTLTGLNGFSADGTWTLIVADGFVLDDGEVKSAKLLITCRSIPCAEFTCGNNDNKIEICHIPPGNPGNAQTLCIAPEAVEAHVAKHGDTCGPCGA